MSSEQFYASLPVITDFVAVTRADSYASLPADWHVALCDVRDSTAAVADGKYRNVNSIGAAAITAVINAGCRSSSNSAGCCMACTSLTART